MMREILVEWTMPSGGNKVSVLYFDTSPSVATQREELGDLLADIRGALDNNISYRVATSGRELNEATGVLTGAWTNTVSFQASGAVSGQQVPDAAQLLIRWHTDQIIAGRFLQGRTFIPGLSASQLVDGNVNPTLLPDLGADCQDFIDAGVLFGVWHRPTSGGAGTHVPATSVDIWPELAVLRRRRG